MFGTSGIRGVVGKDITPELAFRVGASVSSPGGKVLIARDARRTGVLLSSALSSGIMFMGADAVDMGIAPTPTLALATKKNRCSGIVVTASHNPPEYNGFKFFHDGMELLEKREGQLAALIKEGKFKHAEWHSVGRYRKMDDGIREHINLVLPLVDTKTIKKKRPKVVVDCGNGAASVIMPYLLRDAGCHVVGVNCEPSGVFNRPLEPNEENLRDTCALVKSIGADMGIAHDGDGDRAIVIDEKGEMLGLDRQLALAVEKMTGKGKGNIVTTVEASLCVREIAKRKKRKIIITPVGSKYVAYEVKRRKAAFGGEPCGEYVFPKGVLTPDGLLSGLLFVELFCREGSLNRLKKRIKTYPLKREKFRCRNKERAMKKIKKELPAGIKGKVSCADGLRIDWDGGWVLVRPSGTEPVIRLTSENKREREGERIFRIAERIIKKSI